MMSILIYSRLDGSQACWVERNREGEPAGEVHAGLPAAQHGSSGQRPCDWVIRGEDLLLGDAQLAMRSSNELQRALPFAMEESLAVDAESQVFGYRREGGYLAVVVADQKALQRGQGLLRAAGLRPLHLFADVLLLQRPESAWAVALEQDRALVRIGRDSGFVCEQDNLEWSLQRAWQEMPQARRPGQIRIIGLQASQTLNLPEGLQLHRDPAPMMTQLARGITSYAGPELPRRVSGKVLNTATRKRWLVALALAILALLLVNVSDWWEASSLAASNRQLQERIATVFSNTFPGERVQDARLQMQQRLQQWQLKQAEAGGVLPILATLAGVLRGEAGTEVRDLSYSQGSMSIDLLGVDIQQLERIKRQLELDGVGRVEIASMQTDAKKVRAQLRIGGTAP